MPTGGTGTEFHLLQAYSFICEGLEAGRFVYVAAVDIEGAFDNVPHESLVDTLKKAQVDPFLCRYVALWLRCRLFCIRLRAPTGMHYSKWLPLSRGLPQGGVLSPFLWLLHIDPLATLI